MLKMPDSYIVINYNSVLNFVETHCYIICPEIWDSFIHPETRAKITEGLAVEAFSAARFVSCTQSIDEGRKIQHPKYQTKMYNVEWSLSY